ncbi:MBG domain-containing protein [Lactiplantibacillus daowaiensis]|uniref:MBG domain-containing protein n=1 Tax=Lactiplantibacillus daowaiensis TaxID=2559918 RepID=A0ABW1RYF1_9LACO|nr:MBG domain-containing protein [Lactiplantibacillus daowaiensis]
MKQKVFNQGIKKNFILYKGHTGWKVKTRIWGSLLLTFSTLAMVGTVSELTGEAATSSAAVTATATSTSTKTAVPASTASATTSTAKSAAPTTTTPASSAAANTPKSSTPTSSTPASTVGSNTATPSATSSTANSSVANSTTGAANVAAAPTASTTSKVQSRAVVPETESVTTDATTSDSTTAKYPVLAQGQSVDVGADTTQVNLTADQIADHFTATVENRGNSDQDDDPTDNTVKQTIGADGTIALTSNDPHQYYTSATSSTTVTGHQAAHVSFEHEIDFSHNFSMSGALGIGSKTSGGADSVGFIFAPGDPAKATEGGSGGLLGIGGLANAFGFVYDEYYNSNYNDPSRSPYIGWRTTNASGNLQSAASTDWKAASQAGLNNRSVNPLNDFTMDYDASTQTLTVVLGSITLSRKITDVSTGYSISVAASTGGSWNDYSARIDKFSYTPKTIPLTINLVDAADSGALLDQTNATAVANIGDTISVFSTQAAADRAVALGEVDPNLVSVLPTDSAGNVYVVDGAQVIANNNGTVHYIGGDQNKAIADAAYYTYTVTDGDSQQMTVPVRLAFTAQVTPVDSQTQQPIAGLQPVTVVTVAGEPTLIQIPGYTPTKVTLAAPVDGAKIAYDNLLIDQTAANQDGTTVTDTTSDAIAHYYTSTGTTVDGQTVVTTNTVGTGQAIADNLNKQSLVTASGQPVASGGKTAIDNTDYYWSPVGNAGATDSTDAAQPQTTNSILVPTTATLQYWAQQAVNNQTEADNYKASAQTMFDQFIGLGGLTAAQKAAAQTSLDAITKIYTDVSNSNGVAKTAFEAAENETDATTIFNDGQTGYAALQKAQNLLVTFKADLTKLDTTNQEAQDSLATLQAWTQTYGTAVQFPVVTFGTGFGDLTAAQIAGLNQAGYFQYVNQNDTTNTPTTPKAVGNYTVGLTDAGRAYLKTLVPGNDNVGLFVATVLTITPKSVTPTIQPTTVTYGNTPTVSGDLGETEDSVMPSDFEIIDNATKKVVTANQLQVNGDYTVQYTTAAKAALKKDTNYTFTTFGTAKMTVIPRAITVTAQNHGKTYGDKGEPILDLTSDSTKGLVNGDQISALGVTLTRAAGEAAGTYAITGTGNSQNYTVTVTPGVFTIAKLPVTVKVADTQKTYGDVNPSFALTDDAKDVLVNGDSLADLGVVTYTTDADAASAVGTYQVTGTTDVGSGNYDVTVEAGTLSIAKRAVTVVANSLQKTYGDTEPVLTLQDPTANLKNGDSAAALGVTLTRTAGEAVGSYTITGTADSQNYAVTVTPGTLKIVPKAVTVTVADQTKIYGDTDDAFKTSSVTGLVTGETVADLGLTFSRTAGEDVGTYTITGQVTDPNYVVTINNGQLTVKQRDITVNVANQTKVYGTKDPVLTIDDPTADLVNHDTAADLAVTLTRVSGEHVGSYAITGKSASKNYQVTVVANTLTIIKRQVTVAATPQTKIYGNADPALTVTIPADTLVNGDTDEAVLGVTLTRVTGETVGTYQITGQSDSQDYDVTVTPGDLVIGQRAVIVTPDTVTKVYGEKDPVLTYTVDNAVNNDDLKVTLSRTAGESVGTYAISVDTADANPNYAITINSGELNITKRPVTITAADLTKVYGEVDPSLTLKDAATVLVNHDDVQALGVTLTRVAGENVGDYVITGTAADNTNYAVTILNGTLSITKRPVTVTAATASKVYGNTDPALQLIDPSSVLKNNDTEDALGVTLTRVAGENVGDYEISGAATDKSNYTVTVEKGTFKITPRPITVTADDQAKIYGNADPALTVTIQPNMLVGNDTATDLAITLKRVAGDSVGTYAITGTAASKNYLVNVNPAAFIIAPRPITVTAASQTKTYGDTDPVLSLVTTTELVGSDTEASLGVTLTRTVGENAGTYTISGQAQSLNYVVTINSGSLMITKRSITVTTMPQTKTYGTSDPVLTIATPTGLQYQDQPAALGLTLTRTKGENVGTYAIDGTAASQNYVVVILPSQLTITPAAASLTINNVATTYGETPIFNEKFSNGVKQPALSQTDFEVVDQHEQVVPVNMLQAGGDYTIRLTPTAKAAMLKTNPNFRFTSFKLGRLNVARRRVTV